ncbi:MAG: glycosyltransferase family 2 protein [Solirubrobacteraceae bacterium]
MTPDSAVPGWDVSVPPPAEAAVSTAAPRSDRGTISVVITYYRGAGVICDAVESVLAQTVRPHEIVICDDGSPDDLQSALGALREHVKVIRKENGGTGSAANAAVRAASGEYVVQLDQDDAFLPRRLEAIAETLRMRPDADIVATDASIEMWGRRITTLEAVNPYPQTDHRVAMLRTCTFLWPAIRRSLLLAQGGYDESFRAIEDWDCFVRLVLGGAVIAYVHEPLYRWRLTPDSRSSQNRVAHLQDQVDLTEKALACSLLDRDERAVAEQLLAGRRRSLARECARRAIETRAPDARRLSLQLLTGAGFDRATRAKAAVAVLSPRLAERLITRRRRLADPAILALAQRGFPAPPANRS